MNAIRRSWSRGEVSVGAWHGWVTPLDAERIGRLSYDWVLYDMESSGLDWGDILPLFQATELGGTRTMVRVPWNSPSHIMRALDYGAIGVVVPMVSTPEDAARAAGASRFPPLGYRSNAPQRRPYPSRAAADEDVVVVAMIETAQALDNLHAIAATPGIDVLMIGQVDLAISLGWLAPDERGINIARDPRCLDALAEVVRASARHGKLAGAATVGASDEEVRTLLELGVAWLGYRPHDAELEQRERDNVRRWRVPQASQPE